MDELIKRFNAAGIRYVLIGGQAMRLAGMPRFSMDWDLFIPPKDEGNVAKINEALTDIIDVPLVTLGDHGENFVQTYQTTWGVIQFHLGVPGLNDFDETEKKATARRTEAGVTVNCACTEDMLVSKKAAGRPEDIADVEFLQKKADN